MQRSLDDTQAKFAAMENPVSNFALREFRLESKVYVEVTDLGTVGYRFVLPGDSVDAAALSTITIDVVPMPKPADELPVTPERPPSSGRSLQALHGMGDDRRRALEERHVRTVGDFVAVATRARGMAALEALLEVDREQLGRWMSQAQLLTIEGVDERSAHVLTKAGIADLAGLAACTPEDLSVRYADAAAALGVAGSLSIKQAQRWIDVAGTYASATAAPSEDSSNAG